ncbi:MAG: type II toxin-antitoxin system RelE/ParE family toxin [Melioribacteraceae bacterium]|nr:type II toxin-antitoxin system RelE/ParE family toxin [Melioribacteraceae bacterium]
MKIEIRKSAIKDLKRIDKKFLKHIHSKIFELQEYPKIENIKKLTNFEPSYRLRIGNYRVLFDILNDTIVIGRVLHRKESYK